MHRASASSSAVAGFNKPTILHVTAVVHPAGTSTLAMVVRDQQVKYIAVTMALSLLNQQGKPPGTPHGAGQMDSARGGANTRKKRDKVPHKVEQA